MENEELNDEDLTQSEIDATATAAADADHAAWVASLIPAEPTPRKRPVGRPRKSEFAMPAETSTEATTSDTNQTPAKPGADIWDSNKPNYRELHRLNESTRSYEQYVRGNFVMRPDADLDKMFDEIFDGRKRTTSNLLKLHRFMKLNSCMTGDPLYGVVEKSLLSEKAIEPESPAAPILGDIFQNVLNKI